MKFQQIDPCSHYAKAWLQVARVIASFPKDNAGTGREENSRQSAADAFANALATAPGFDAVKFKKACKV